ncbi:hypothetical protein K2173_006027 [Erythroxylum novogranatense]|uniref:Uncharacterized protein n=1 Tax=Erythroxylum novogranatense TaxID=1862640 RepID=A0AAV8TBP7_9ROSI|nr:hypothetical protein K2173_006027 [Erythroxylum novogranatense]
MVIQTTAGLSTCLRSVKLKLWYKEELVNFVANEDAIDVELQRRSKETEDGVVFLSEELDQDSFQDSGFDFPSSIQIIRNLMADKVSLAIEVSGVLESRIAERDSAMKEFKLAKAGLESRTQRLENEMSELQSALGKERLRERVRELAGHNVFSPDGSVFFSSEGNRKQKYGNTFGAANQPSDFKDGGRNR